jgi:ribosomal protein S18 acetylase RimI-like enzyme
VIESLARAARDIGATRLSLEVLFSNAHARRLYERLGFIATDAGFNIAMVKRLQ